MKRTSYLKRASQRFLAGTKFRSPVAAVEAGVKTLEAWAEALAEEREAEERLILEYRLQRRHDRTAPALG